MTLEVPNRSPQQSADVPPVIETSAKRPPLTEQSNPFAETAPASSGQRVETDNPYQAPTDTGLDGTLNSTLSFRGRDPRLASLGKRFAGSLIDSLILVTPLVVMEALAELGVDEMFVLVVGLTAWTAILVVHMTLVSVRGQSIAKLLLGMKIVKVRRDVPPGFFDGIVLRAFLPGCISALPAVGTLFTIANPLFIFGDERQCLHDKIAGTKVLDCKLMEIYAHRFGASGGRRIVYPGEGA